MCLRSLPGGITHTQWGGGVCSLLFLPGDLLRFGKPANVCSQNKGQGASFLFYVPCLAKLMPQCFGSSYLLVLVFLAHEGQRNRYGGSAPWPYFSTPVTNWPRSQNVSIDFKS